MREWRLHVDTDIGADADDLCAIAYLLKRRDVTVTGITTCLDRGGRRTRYVKRLLELCGAEGIPVGAGEDGTLESRTLYDAAFSTEEIMFGPEIAGVPPAEKNAEEILEGSLASGAAVVSIGPLTNIARLVRKKGGGIFPAGSLYFMGGSLHAPEQGYPGWGRENDWNINMDLPAADIVLNRCHLTMVEIAPTLKTFLTERDCARLEDGGAVNRLIAKQGRLWKNHAPFIKEETIKCGKLPRDLCNFHYDPLTCAIAAGFSRIRAIEETIGFRPDPEKHTYELSRKDGGNRVTMVFDADGQAFDRSFMETMLKTRTELLGGVKIDN